MSGVAMLVPLVAALTVVLRPTPSSSSTAPVADSLSRPRFVVEPKSAFVRRGDSATLTCDVSDGGGFDVIGWLHDGVPVTSSRHVTVDGGSLRITSFGAASRLVHEGSYQCVAGSEAGSFVSRPGRLYRAALDSYAESLADRNVTVIAGNVAVIPCAAASRSMPSAVTQFEFGGVRLRMTPRHRLLPSGSLQIESVSKDDDGLYRCVAVNPVSLDRLPAPNTVRLVVSEPTDGGVPARFTWTPLTMVEVIQSETLTLECVAEGWPVPAITWQRHGGGTLPHGRHRYILGNLVVSNVQKEDSGTYVCRADNGIGHPQVVAFVEVLEPPTIVVPPMDQRVSEGGTVTFECTPKGTFPMSIIWLHNALPVTPDQSTHMFNFSLQLVDIRHRDAGFYQCLVNNSVDVVIATAQLLVDRRHAGGRTEHGAVDHHRMRDAQLSSVRPFRRKTLTPSPAVHRAPVESSAWRYSTDLEDDAEFSDENGEDTYEVAGVMTASDDNARMVPPPTPSVTKHSDSSALLQWPEQRNAGLPVTFLKVQYRETLAKENSKRRTNWKTIDDDIDPTARSYVVSDLKPGATYYFRLVAVYSNNDNKHGHNSDKFVLPPAAVESRPPDTAPVIVRVQSSGKTAISVAWQYLSSEHSNSVDGFYIYYRPYASSAEYRRSAVPGGAAARHMIMSGLAPDTTYSIRMRSFNTYGYSEFSNTVVKKTLGSSSDYSDMDSYDDVIADTATRLSDTGFDPRQTVKTAPHNDTLFVALGISFGVVVVVLVIVVAMCAWRHQKQRRLLESLQLGVGDVAFYDSKAITQTSSKLHRPLMTADTCAPNFVFTGSDDNKRNDGVASTGNGSWNRNRVENSDAENTLTSHLVSGNGPVGGHTSPLWSRSINADNYRLDDKAAAVRCQTTYNQPVRYDQECTTHCTCRSLQ